MSSVSAVRSVSQSSEVEICRLLKHEKGEIIVQNDTRNSNRGGCYVNRINCWESVEMLTSTE